MTEEQFWQTINRALRRYNNSKSDILPEAELSVIREKSYLMIVRATEQFTPQCTAKENNDRAIR
jgi:hypothetical protein